DEPPLEQRLRGLLFKLPDPTKEVTPPTEAERLREDARRARGSRDEAPRGRGYIGPLSTETPTGRMGVSGWTGPSADPAAGGYCGFGYSVEWGVPRRSSFEAP